MASFLDALARARVGSGVRAGGLRDLPSAALDTARADARRRHHAAVRNAADHSALGRLTDHYRLFLLLADDQPTSLAALENVVLRAGTAASCACAMSPA